MNTAVLDLFLGDCGKGKIVDYLAESHNSVVRFNGSNNAGHTLKHQGITYKTHAIPSGVLYKHTTNLIGHGCTIDPSVLVKEIQQFSDINERVFISGNSHIILPEHIELDIEREKKFGIGSTKRGVSPAYEAKAGRRGLQYKDLLLEETEFKSKLNRIYPSSPLTKLVDKKTTAKINQALEVYQKYSQILKKHILTDSVGFLHDVLIPNGKILFEGAQGTFLDVDFGEYPFVTSSNCTVGSIFTGTGLNPNQLDQVIGVIKAYGSYVGTNSDFQDIEDQKLNQQLCDLGQEYGATTGRRRRLCWLDLDMIKRAVQINGPTKLVITRMDTLGQMPEIYIKSNNQLHKFRSWGNLSDVKTFHDIPNPAMRYLNFIYSKLQVPIWAIGTGPERKDLIIK